MPSNSVFATLCDVSGAAWRYVRLAWHARGCACWRGCDTCRRGIAAVAVYAGCIRITVLCVACATAHREAHQGAQLELFAIEGGDDDA